MKKYTVDEFVEACEWLRRNPYDLKIEEHIPEGECNGHRVKVSKSALTSVVIDGRLINLGVVNERYPNGHITYWVQGQNMTGPEYVTHVLEGRLTA